MRQRPGHGKSGHLQAYMLASKAPLRRGVSLGLFVRWRSGRDGLYRGLFWCLAKCFPVAGKAMQISRFFEIAALLRWGFDRASGSWYVCARSIKGCGQ